MAGAAEGDAGVAADGGAMVDGTEVMYVHGVVVQNAGEGGNAESAESEYGERGEDASAAVVANGYGVMVVVGHGAEGVARVDVGAAVAAGAAIGRADVVVGEAAEMRAENTNDSTACWE